MVSPSWASSPSIRSLSTRFLGQPRLTKATVRMELRVLGIGIERVEHFRAEGAIRYRLHYSENRGRFAAGAGETGRFSKSIPCRELHPKFEVKMAN
jgi:hypothetical protein